MILDTSEFFNQYADIVAKNLIGKIIRHKKNNIWLSAQIIETEAYCVDDKASHASLGYTEKRKALFMAPGTIYMYYSRGKDSLNISCKGAGSAVLIKSGIPFFKDLSDDKQNEMIQFMTLENPIVNLKTGKTKQRKMEKLCSGQTLFCKSLDIKLKDWTTKNFDYKKLKLEKTTYKPKTILQTTRLGIKQGRDEDLLYRFIDKKYAKYSTKNPLTMVKKPKFNEINI